jgi:hypothetical protein
VDCKRLVTLLAVIISVFILLGLAASGCGGAEVKWYVTDGL